MYFLVYLSSATKLLEDNELKDILEKSRKNNSELDITGLLIYMDGNIIQLLEGEKGSVIELYNKISNDQRHKGLIKIIDGDIDKRNFPDWSMGFKMLSRPEAENISGFKSIGDLRFSQLRDQEIHPAFVILQSFIKNSRM